MIHWTDTASIVFICVTANHLGLVKAIEEMVHRELRIVNCPKCFSFWSVLVYTAFVTQNVITSLAVSFLASYMAIWLELLEGYIDTLYMNVYEKIYSDTSNDTVASDPKRGDSDSSVPKL